MFVFFVSSFMNVFLCARLFCVGLCICCLFCSFRYFLVFYLQLVLVRLTAGALCTSKFAFCVVFFSPFASFVRFLPSVFACIVHESVSVCCNQTQIKFTYLFHLVEALLATTLAAYALFRLSLATNLILHSNDMVNGTKNLFASIMSKYKSCGTHKYLFQF